MAQNDLAVFGMASPGFHRLVEGLAPAKVEVLSLAEPGSPAALAAVWVAGLEPAESMRAMLVYQAPWRFLQAQFAHADCAPAELESTARGALESWERHSAALLQLAQRLGARALLVNADRVVEPMRLVQVIQEKLGVRQGWRHGASTGGAAFAPELIYRQVVNALAPASLALYSSLESCAELLGAEPGLQPAGATAAREDTIGELLELAVRQARAEEALAKAGRLNAENALYFVQLQQLEEQLTHFYEQDRQKTELIAKLEAPLVRRLARRAGAWAATLLASTIRLRQGREPDVQREAVAVRASGLFDERWYRDMYPDVVAAGIDPLEHFLRYGAGEGRNPGPVFDTQWYLQAYPDVAASAMNPLLHFVQFGLREGRQCMPGTGDTDAT
jgi:hypothetical protein